MSDKSQSQSNPEATSDSGAPRKEKPKAFLYGRANRALEGEPDNFQAMVWFAPTSKLNTLTGFIRDLHDNERKSLCVIQDPRPQKETGELITDLVVSENVAAPGQEPQWKTIAIGHVVNSRKDGKPVNFDDVLFSPRDPSLGTEPIRARETMACTPEMHKRLGFTQDRIPRASREGDREQSAPQGDRQAPAAARQSSRGQEDPLDVPPEATPAKRTRSSRAKPRAAAREQTESFGPTM
ncbi:hypothetical protein LA345_13365 [Burkholderia vietnamiensis]|uniref:Uncharacterized protein n=1 Tax=Burkholderia vietnamiensis (strain G4 / LMG 22486) TaxID=269482 RepID=A4JFU4_BURVG|nr:hypothetical protein Bcep1808_2145 [Burkholderia vietnamiensis G4]MCB4344903.1 hypothetical protein [Burkholderia vietnamiensis]